jgi:CheY-like chemotaxis protein
MLSAAREMRSLAREPRLAWTNPRATQFAERPNVVVSDLAMHGEDGFELSRRLRQLLLETGGQIPSAAFRGYSSDTARDRAPDVGFSVHGSKSVDPDELVDVVASRACRDA